MPESGYASDLFPPVGEMSERIGEKLDETDRLAEENERNQARAKTRFLGFIFSDVPKSEQAVEGVWDFELSDNDSCFDRLVIIEGAGRGRSFTMKHDYYRIGRGDGQEIQLNFGDNSVSRETHATVVRSSIHGGLVIRDGRKPNPALLNGRPFDGEEILNNGDLVRVGETTLRFLTAS